MNPFVSSFAVYCRQAVHFDGQLDGNCALRIAEGSFDQHVAIVGENRVGVGGVRAELFEPENLKQPKRRKPKTYPQTHSYTAIHKPGSDLRGNQHPGYASSDFAVERIIASRADAITESGKIRP